MGKLKEQYFSQIEEQDNKAQEQLIQAFNLFLSEEDYDTMLDGEYELWLKNKQAEYEEYSQSLGYIN
jgi:hypothetical protein